jgi:hypothetical protein
LAALSKVKLDNRDEIEGTTFEGSEIIRVTYKMKCGEAFTTRCHPKVPWKAVALAALSKVNDETMMSILRDALSSKEELEANHKMRPTKAFQALVDKHEVTKNGMLTGTVTIEGVTQIEESDNFISCVEIAQEAGMMVLKVS